MCQFFSCIITRDLKVHWSKRTMAHEELLAELRLEDKKLEDRDFVRVEICPKDVRKVSRCRDDWVFKVDEERTLPDWYDENVVKCKKACWKAWEESIQVNLAVDKEELSGKGQLFFAYGSSTVHAYGSSTVRAYDSSTVRAYDSSKVELKSDYASVLCHGKIFVTEKAEVVRASVVKAAEV